MVSTASMGDRVPGLTMRAVSLRCALVALPLLAYGAVGRNTLGGLNVLATLLALTLAALGLVLGGILLVRRRPTRLGGLLALIVNLALCAGSVAVLLTREFAMGYMPC